MDYEIEYLPEALMDIEEIADYLSQYYENTLKNFLTSLEKKISALSDTPYMYEIFKPRPEYRKLVIDKYIAFYKVDKKKREVKIYRVLHGARDINSLLKRNG